MPPAFSPAPQAMPRAAVNQIDAELDGLQVLLITSRKTGRWVIPKGNIGKGHNARQAAEHAAYEEAGVRGNVEKAPLGSYTYEKALKDGTPTVAKVFAMGVLKEAKAWPAMAERRSEWMEPKEAARRVHEAGLATLLLQLAERHPAPPKICVDQTDGRMEMDPDAAE